MTNQTLYLGIDIGGTKIGIGAVSRGGELLAVQRFTTPWGGYAQFQDRLSGYVDTFLQTYGDLEFAAVGVGFRALVDYRRQRIACSSIISDARDFDICQCLRQKLHLPIIVDNDVNAMACGELVFGLGKETGNFAYVNIGTGLGLGIVADGHLIRGSRCQAGEISCYLTEECTFMDLESLLSGRGLDKRVRQLSFNYPESVLASRLGSNPLQASEMIAAWRQGDRLAARIMEQGVHALALAIFNMETVLDSGLYIFGGGVVGDGWIISQIEEEIRCIAETASMPFEAKMKLSALGASHSGLIGAAALSIHETGGTQ